MKTGVRLWSLCICCAATTCFAEHVSVTVIDTVSQSAVADATVVLSNPSAPASAGKTPAAQPVDHTQTDNRGQAHFDDVRFPVDIRVLAPGYKIHSTTVTQGVDRITIDLQPQTVHASGIDVVANRIEDTTSRFDLPAEVLTRSAGSGDDPLRTITSLPGVVETEESSSRVYMRGSGSDDNIVWINRAPVGYLYHFGGFQSTIHPKLVEDINVFPGGFPIEYGDALGGAIDVRLRTPRNDRLHSYLDVSTVTTSFLLEGPAAGEDSFFIGGRRSYLDAILSPQGFSDAVKDDNDPDPDQYTLVPRFYDFQALHHHKLDNGSLDTYLFAAGDKQSLDVRGSAAADPQLAGRLSSTIEYQTAGTTWRQLWNDRWSHVMVVAFQRNRERLQLGRDDNGDPFYVNVDADTLLWQPEVHYRYSERSSWDFGVAGNYTVAPVDLYFASPPNEDNIDYDFTSQRKYRLDKDLYLRSVNTYARYRRQWTDKLVTAISVGHSDVNVTGGFEATAFSPRAAIEYQLTGQTRLSASWGRYLQTPDAIEMIENFGNPQLEMQEAEHRIIGVEHQFDELYSIKTEIYHKPMKNLVVYLEDNPAPDNYANAGSGDAYGVDIYLKRKAQDNRFGWLSASWSRSERDNALTDESHRFIGDVPWSVTAVWGQPFESPNWTYWEWSIKAQANAGRLYTPVIGRHRETPGDDTSRWIPEYADQNSARTPVYYKVDLRVGRKLESSRSSIKFYVDIQNISLADNVLEYDYGNEYEYIDDPKEIVGMRFFPYFGVEMEF